MMPMTPSGTLTREILRPFGRDPFGEHAADRVGQRGDVLEPLRDRFEPLRVEREAVEQRGADAAFPRRGEVVGIGGEDLVGPAAHRGRRTPQRLCPRLGRSQGQRRGGLARAPPDRGHRRGEIAARRLRSRTSVSVVIGVIAGRSPPDRRGE